MPINPSSVNQVNKPFHLLKGEPLDVKFKIASRYDLYDIAPAYVGHIFYSTEDNKHYKVTSLADGYLDYTTNTIVPEQPPGGEYSDYEVVPNYFIDVYSELGVGGSAETPQTIKTKYESNPNTNAYTDAEKTKLASVEPGAQVNPTFKTVGGQTITGTGNIPVTVPFNLQSDSILTYANLPTGLNNTTDVNKAYYVQSDKLVYVWDGASFPLEGEGLNLQADSTEVEGVLKSYVTDYISDTLFEFETGLPLLFGIDEEKGLLSTNNTKTPYTDPGWDFRLFRNIPISSEVGTIKKIHLEVVRPGGFPNNCTLIGVRQIDGGIEVLIPSLVSPSGNLEVYDFDDLSDYRYISFAQYVTSNFPQSQNTSITFTVEKEDVVKKDVNTRVVSSHIDLISDMGCAGDGVTDDTDKINEAIERLVSLGGGIIYGRDRKFKVSSIQIPSTSKWITIEICGAKTPAARIGTIGNFDVSAPNGMMLISDLQDVNKGVINVAQGGLYYDFTGVLLKVRDLSIRTYENPQISGINASYAAQVYIENVDINTGVYSVQAIEPTYPTSGIKLPIINNAAFNYLRYVSVAGYNRGLEVEEHTDGDALLFHSCKHALYIKEANHASYFKRILGQRNQNQLTVVGSHVFEIAQLNMEFAADTGQTTPQTEWQKTIYEINDPSNLGVGNITYANVKGNFGKISTCRINGGANLLIKKVGSNTLLTAPGIPG